VKAVFNKLLNDNINCKIVRILAAWYSTQTCSVKWGGVTALRFCIGNGTRQGGVISPYLFARYIRELLGSVRNTGIGCFVGDVCMNILAYADDIVVLAPSWHALQMLLNVLHSQSILIDVSCNVNKTVCMIFKPKRQSSIIRGQFPPFRIGANCVQYVSDFQIPGRMMVIFVGKSDVCLPDVIC